MSAAHKVNAATVRWGQQWPEPPGPNQPPAPGPVITVRASDYALQTSMDGHTWTTVAEVHGNTKDTVDKLTFEPTRARYLRVSITKASGATMPMLQELTVTA
jgi:F5/8 type C domain-containing protein